MGIATGREAEAAAWERALARLRKEPWFSGATTPAQGSASASNWLVQQMGPTGLQLSKGNWFNEDGNGIHFETWTTPEDVERGAMTFQAHVMHAGCTFPGTGKKAAALARPVLARCGEVIRSWGYKTPRAPGMTLLKGEVPFGDLADVPEIVVRECGRFATLAPAIDEVLACILEGRAVPRVGGGTARTQAKASKPAETGGWGASILPAFEGVGDSARGWHTRTEERGEIEVVSERGGVLRVVIGPRSRHGYHATLRCSGISMRAGRTYRVTFAARAKEAYRIAGNIRQSGKPFLTVGFFPGLTIGTEWHTHAWTLTAERDEPDACLTWALGKTPNTVWLKDFAVQPAE